jgi:hypothetical protein
MYEFSDLAVALLVRDDADSEKSRRSLRRAVRTLFRLFVYRQEADPRVKAICRYLESPRNSRLDAMVREWAGTEVNAVRLPQEFIACHQHVLARLRAVSRETRDLVEYMYGRVRLSASLFLAFAWLLLIGLLALPAKVMWGGVSLPFLTGLFGCIVVYVGAAVTGHSLVRGFRHFCAQTLTLGMHVHASGASPQEPSPGRAAPRAQMPEE